MPGIPFGLSELERDLLARHYNFYRALANGSRSPTSKAQRRFVAVCRGEAEPETEHERAYVDLRRLARLSGMTELELAACNFAPQDRTTHDPPTSPSLGQEAADLDLGQFEE